MLDYDAGHWLPLVTDAAIKSAAVLTMTLALFLGLRRASAAARHLLLLAGVAVLLGLPLLMPFVPRQSLPKAPTPPPARTPAASVPAMPTVILAPTDTAAEPPAASLSPVPSLPPPAAVVKPPNRSPLPGQWAAWVVCGWLVGVLLCTLRFVTAQTRIGRLMRRCSPQSEDWQTTPETAPFSQVKTSPMGTPPMVWGWPRPTLLLPSDAAQWPKARLRAVLLHEAAHVRRQDWLTQTLTQAACALYWFNPLIWLTASQMQAEAERACDDAVLLAGIPPADYAQDLLAVARSLTAAQRASFGAVTMARHSPVRTRLEAILDPARPRRRTTRRADVLALTVALAIAVPLAALRPAARAAAPAAVKLGLAAPAAGVPTESDIAKVQRHLQLLERDRLVSDLIGAQPNMLTAAQTADVDQWLRQMELKREREEMFPPMTGAQIAKLRVDAKKPHTLQERRDIWAAIFAYEHPPQVIVQRQRAEAQWFARMNTKIKSLDEYQVVREKQRYAFDKKIALDKTQIEKMEMERSLGYSLPVNPDDFADVAQWGLASEKAGEMTRANRVHLFLLNAKLMQGNPLSDADLDSVLAILRAPSTHPGEAHAYAIAVFLDMRTATADQQQKMREAVTPLLTSPGKLDRTYSKAVLRKYGLAVPTPGAMTPKAQAAPGAAPRPAPQQPKLTGVSLMTPLKNLKTALLKTAAFATLTAGLTLPAVSAPPVPTSKPAVPKPTSTTPTDALHWHKISLQQSTVGTNPAFALWRKGGNLRGTSLPEGVKRLFFLTKDNAILVQATADGFAKMQEIINSVDVAPRQVQVKAALANVPQANINALGVNFVLVPQNRPLDTEAASQPATQTDIMPSPLLYLDGNIAAELLKTFTKQGRVSEAPVVTTTSNVAASINMTSVQPHSTLLNLSALRVTQRVNTDNSVTLQLHWTISSTTPQGTVVKTIQEINALRTITNGDTLALSIATPKSAGEGGHSLLLFVTPTIVPD